MERKENDSISFYEEGKRLQAEIEKNKEIAKNSEGEEKVNAEKLVESLNKDLETLKEKMRSQAKEKSGLDYSKDDKNPEILRKQYTERLSEIKKRKQELRLEKIRIQKLSDEKSKRIESQFEIAAEKYKMMLDAGKITRELYETRIKNMDRAKVKDLVDLYDPIENIDKEYSALSKESDDLESKLSELNKKEIIYNEYGDAYYRLFGELLSDKDKVIEPKQTNSEPDTNASNKKGEQGPENIVETPSNGVNGQVNNIVPNSGVQVQQSNGINQPSETGENGNAVSENADVRENKEPESKEKKVVITGKRSFKELYKKLKKGTITDSELNALTETLENPDDYDKYGITTGIVFNKAKKILKYKGDRTAKSIEKFLRENGVFSDSIRFNNSIEKDNVLSHDILRSWKDIDDKLVYTDATFSVEKYIEKIEEYKQAGNTLTPQQEEMLKNAISVKNNLASYRKALNTNDDVTRERGSRLQNSPLYRLFSGKAKAESSKSLPASSTDDACGFIVMPENLDLSSMVSGPNSRDLEQEGSSKPKTRDSDVVK